MTINNKPLTGWKIIKAADLGEYGARTCELCGREIRYLIITRDTEGIPRYLGAECASKVENISPHDLALLQRCIFKEDHRVPAAVAQLPKGFLIPPVPTLNGPPIIAAIPCLRFSLMPEIAPQPFHISEFSGYWCRCTGRECTKCARRSPVMGSLYAVCVWKLDDGGTLHIPKEWTWPYGCTSFRALALRDVDVSAMHSLRDNIYGYDWQIDRTKISDKPSSFCVRLMGASSLQLAGSFVSKLALQHTEVVDGVTRWNDLIMSSGPTQAELDKEAEELKRFTEFMVGYEGY